MYKSNCSVRIPDLRNPGHGTMNRGIEIAAFVGNVISRLPHGTTIPLCYIDAEGLAAVIAEYLTTVAPEFTTAAQPPVNQDITIPVDSIGGDNYLLAEPAVWLKIVANGNEYRIPAYNPV